MTEPDITKKPQRNAGDVVHTLVKAGISSLPCVGSSASELFSLVVTPSLEKRRDEWIESIAKTLKALEEKVDGFKIENLQENEAFVSTVVQASLSAIRDHQKDKLEAFKNAILNTALPDTPDEELRLIFLEFINTLTPLHLKVLAELNKPPWIKYNKFKEESFPKLTKNHPLCETIVRDLYSCGLVNITPDPGGGVIYTPERNTTDLGRAFLKFITSPFED